jgi:deoxyribonuclease V
MDDASIMLLAVDVYYDEGADRATAAGVVFAAWSATAPVGTVRHVTAGLAPYHPGEFFQRELPCLVPLIEDAIASHALVTVIVDGFVDLGERGAGLGRHLYRAFDGVFEVVGVAKNPFHGNPGVPVRRGGSTRPLWVTATGDAQAAADHLRSMAGPHRMPQMLRLVDQLSRAP